MSDEVYEIPEQQWREIRAFRDGETEGDTVKLDADARRALEEKLKALPERGEH